MSEPFLGACAMEIVDGIRIRLWEKLWRRDRVGRLAPLREKQKLLPKRGDRQDSQETTVEV